MKVYSLLFFTNSILCLDNVVSGYFVAWGNITYCDIPYHKLTHIYYAFGTLTNKANPADIFWTPEARASKNKPKVLISLGGWTGSQTFSAMVQKKKTRKAFIDQVIKFLEPAEGVNITGELPKSWGLDGVDLDWEYPGRKGIFCNSVDKDDTSNYLTLLKEMRAAIDTRFTGNNTKLITAAVRVEPFDDEKGEPLKDVSEFAKLFDFVNVMAYDIHVSYTNTTAPNAPFDYRKGKGKAFSFKQSLEAWKSAGTSKATEMVTKDNQFVLRTKDKVKGDETDILERSILCDEPGPLAHSGIYKYNFLRKDILKKDYKTPIKEYVRYFDNITKTPYLQEKATKKFISYDDPESIKIKTDYILENKYRGVMFWELSNDYKDELLDATQGLMSKNPASKIACEKGRGKRIRSCKAKAK
ncbi:hypothetical protein L0F63_004072 [Massospora cicadina]|nr:hypothetical protein L0F63_004072 [Massospora cicadina]